MEVIDNLTSMITTNLEMVNNNKILSSVIGLFLVLYAALAAPKLPKSVTLWFDNMWFKLGFMFLIAYTATKDPSVAIISAVALLVTLQTLSAQKTTETVIQSVQAKVESFADIVKLKEKLIMAESEGNVRTESRSEVRTESRSEVRPESRSEVRPESRSEVRPESRSEVRPESRSEVRPESRSEVQPSHAEVQPSHAEIYPSRGEVYSSHAEVKSAHAESEYRQTRQEGRVYQEQVSDTPSNCNNNLDDLSGYEFGELATF